MQKQKRSNRTPLLISLAIISLTLLAASCNDSNEADLKRPVKENNMNENSVSENNTNAAEEKGEVAGTEIIELPRKKVVIAEKEIEVEIADTDDARANGLSNRTKLEDGTGMIFDFTNTQLKEPGFWMKDMLFSIDMIWIKNGKIIGITPNVPPAPENKNFELYYPPSEVSHVLEVPAGWSAKNNLKIGDGVKL